MSSKSLESGPFSLPFTELPTPLHVYFESRLLEDASALKSGLLEALPTLQLYYSTKTNSLLPLLKALLREGWGLETVCPGDREAAKAAGAPGSRLLLNGAAWGRSELEEALFGLEVAQVTLDSQEMAGLLGSVLSGCSRKRPPLRVALRVHDGESHFGLSPDPCLLKAAWEALPKSSLGELGLHLHRNPHGSPASLEEMVKDFEFRLERLAPLAGALAEVSFLDLGGGIDSPWIYRPQPQEWADFHNPDRAESVRGKHSLPRFSLREAGYRIASALKEKLGPNNGRWRLQLEPGRAVCTRALSTLLEVKAVKPSLYPDAAIAITDGNTAILGPLHRGVHPVEARSEGNNKTFIYGNLPHSGDWLFQAVNMPALQRGDRILISHTGAYFLALEANFGQPRPGIYREGSGELVRFPEKELAVNRDKT